MGEKESVHCQEQEEDQVRDQVNEEEESSIRPPLLLQQTGHNRVPQQVITFVLYLQHNRIKESAFTSIDTIAMVTII